MNSKNNLANSQNKLLNDGSQSPYELRIQSNELGSDVSLGARAVNTIIMKGKENDWNSIVMD